MSVAWTLVRLSASTPDAHPRREREAHVRAEHLRRCRANAVAFDQRMRSEVAVAQTAGEASEVVERDAGGNDAFHRARDAAAIAKTRVRVREVAIGGDVIGDAKLIRPLHAGSPARAASLGRPSIAGWSCDVTSASHRQIQGGPCI